MRAISRGLSAALAGLLLLTACGQETGAAHRSDGSACGTGFSSKPAASRAPSAEETDGVVVTGVGGGPHRCATYQVTNRGTEPFTYAVTFKLVSDSGAAPESRSATVPSVGPGRTVTGSVSLITDVPDAPEWSRVEVTKVRSVPVDEAPAEGGRCPSSGVRLYADDGDAAMGLRVVTLHLENCGTGTFRVDGYPRVSPLGEDHRPVNGVRVLHDGSSIAGSTGADGPPRPLALKPGERAHAGLVWRNTVLSGTPVNAPYVRVWAEPGAAPVMVTPELDLGTTGKFAVGPWKKGE
ncbi:DUF4232 domain-containing protein [Streptomyces sp. NPDC001435]|uniref:DUF4232 domain-containing protein n=1 Tax=Streptomyces sp. NPDC001435 TaxID=3364576 RepID=UPI00369744B2